MKIPKTDVPALRSRVSVVSSILVAATLLVGISACPATAATLVPSAPGTGQSLSQSLSTDRVAAITPGSINPYGCGAIASLGYHQMFVAAFALGYCPSVFTLQGTSWGRSFTNWVATGLCRSPWIVRAATGGRFSTC